MSVINQDDFLGRIDHVIGNSGTADPSLEEQRQIENLQRLEMEHLLTPTQEFEVLAHENFGRKMKSIILNRHRRRSIRGARRYSQRQWKKLLQLNVALGEVTEFLFMHIVGIRSEAAAALHDELHAFSTRFYVKDVQLFEREIPLTSKPGSPTVRFVNRQYVDRIGNTLPYQDWVLRITENGVATIIELPYVLDELVNEYLADLALAAEEGGWVVK